MAGLTFDVRYAVRLLKRSPGFSAVVVFLLAVGVGGTTAMFSVVNAVLVRLPFRDADRLVRFTLYDAVHGVPTEVSYVDVRDWRRANHTFEDIAAIGSTNWSHTLEGEHPVSVPNAAVSGNFFDILE